MHVNQSLIQVYWLPDSGTHHIKYTLFFIWLPASAVNNVKQKLKR